MKGYKAFDINLKCRDFQYEIGQTYEMDGEIKCHVRGFHFCKDLANCYKFYEMSDDTRICEVEAIGEIKEDDGIQYCTNKIKILSEISDPRIKSNVNTSSSGYCNSGNFNNGNYNSGVGNSGDLNSGNCNGGNFNTGDWNTGDYNSGNKNKGFWNSGNRNSGHYNSGNCNRGEYNSGEYNIGDWNSGDWNKGNRNVGVFNCDTDPKIKMFDKESDWTMKDWRDSKACEVMLRCPNYSDSDYGAEQKKSILKEATAKDRQAWWDELSEDDKNAVKSLPNFDADKFYLCTGISI